MLAATAARQADAGATSRPQLTERARRAQLALARRTMDGQVERSLGARGRQAGAHVLSASELQAALSTKRTQLARIAHARAAAMGDGDSRRVAELDQRARRVQDEVDAGQQKLNASRGDPSATAGERAALQGRFLDDQARLPRGSTGSAAAAVRDYAALAGLAGYGREEYEQLDGRRRREARLQIDRELAARRELRPALQDAASAASGRATPRERREARRGLEDALERRMRAAGHEMPDSLAPDRVAIWARRGRARERVSGAQESSVMRDAREVAMRRKRQLGLDRP
jgi:hypothetical protein